MALLRTLPACRATTTIEFWHAMDGALEDVLDDVADGSTIPGASGLHPVGKGSYEVVDGNRSITDEAASGDRAGERARLPHHAIVGRHHSGRGTRGEGGLRWTRRTYRPVATYYSKDGTMMAMPFDSVVADPVLQRRSLRGRLRQTGRDVAELETQLYANDEDVECAMVLPATGNGASSSTAPSKTSLTPRRRLRRPRRRVRLRQERRARRPYGAHTRSPG